MKWHGRHSKAPLGKRSDRVDRNFVANSPPFFYLIGYHNMTMWSKPQQFFSRRMGDIALEVKFLRNGDAEGRRHD